jgi:hypothetical protein
MARDFTAVLQQAMEFYVAGQIVEARALLLDVVRADSKIEAGWMFLSYTLDDPKQMADCYRKVLAINPNNAEAKAALEKIEANLQIAPQAPRRTAELLHQSPFTVDIDHADDDISAFGKSEAPAASGAPARPIQPVTDRPPQAPPAASSTAPRTPAVESAAAKPEPAQPPPVMQAAVPVQPPPQKSVEPPTPTPAAPPKSPPAGISQKAAAQPPAAQPAAPAAAAPFVAAPASGPPPSAATEHPTVPSAIPVPPFIAEHPDPAAKIAPKIEQKPPAAVPAPRPVVRGKSTGELAHKAAPAKPAPKTPETAEPKPTKKKGNRGCTCLIVVVILALIAVGIGVGLYLAGFIPQSLFAGFLPAPVSVTPQNGMPTDTPAPPAFTLPPEWTPTPTPTITPTKTITSTPTQTLSPTYEPPEPTARANMDKIQKQVEDLRGLSLKDPLPVYIVSTYQAEEILQAEMDRLGYRETIQNEAKALVALGFIKPTYDLSKYALERLSDGVLGFYMPARQTVYVIGSRFGGMEKLTYSHEFDHALVHNNFPSAGVMETDPICVNDTQRCEAIRALVEGDATFLMLQWFLQYATQYDLQDIGQYQMPFGLPPADNTPPYAEQLVNFSYDQGAEFVMYFYDKGNWARVNKLYENMPVSTEQILHPEKYERGEKPVVLDIPDLSPALGDSWSPVKSDTLGEFMTYLLLAYNADAFSQVASNKATAASAGWGGDHYQVYASAQSGQTLLSAEWTWDTDKDATEFNEQLMAYVDMRFRGEKAEGTGDCWTMNAETTCIFRKGRNTLWILGPTMEMIGSVRSAYGY